MFDTQFGQPYKTEVKGYTMKVAQGPSLEIYTSPNDEEPIADYLKMNGPGLYCVVWRVDDIEATKEQLASFVVDPAHEFEEPTYEVFFHPSDFFGMFTVFLEYPIPSSGVSGRLDRFDRSFTALVVVDNVVEDNCIVENFHSPSTRS